jgi:hypothetical protein
VRAVRPPVPSSLLRVRFPSLTLTATWSLACLAWPLQQDSVFVQPVSSPECGFLFVAFPDWDQVESTLEVYFREPLGFLDPVLKFLHQGKWVSVWYRDFVDLSIVDAQMESSAVGFWHQENQGAGTGG